MMSPAGFNHGRIAHTLGRLIGNFVGENSLGIVTAAETGFILSRDPDTVRAPDVGFVSRDRAVDAPTRGFFPGPPDLAVEVLSPDDTATEVLAKVEDWLRAGTLEVWVVDPGHKTISVYRHEKDQTRVTNHTADDEVISSVLPGLRLAVRDMFR